MKRAWIADEKGVAIRGAWNRPIRDRKNIKRTWSESISEKKTGQERLKLIYQRKEENNELVDRSERGGNQKNLK